MTADPNHHSQITIHHLRTLPLPVRHRTDSPWRASSGLPEI